MWVGHSSPTVFISCRITKLGCPIGEIPDVVSPTPPETLGQRRSYPARLIFFRYTPRTLMLLFTPAAPNYMPVQDLAAATAWYVEKFGGRPRPTKFDDGRRGAELWLADEVYFVLGPRDIPTGMWSFVVTSVRKFSVTAKTPSSSKCATSKATSSRFANSPNGSCGSCGACPERR